MERLDKLGYSSTLKNLIDRFMVLGILLYMVKDGDLLHPMRYDMQYLLGIGLLDSDYIEQRKVLKN